MINTLQSSLNLPVWASLPGCSELTAIISADPIAPRQGESLITAFGRFASGHGLDHRRTDVRLMTPAKCNRRKRPTFGTARLSARSFPLPDTDDSAGQDDSDGPEHRRPPGGGDDDADQDDSDGPDHRHRPAGGEDDAEQDDSGSMDAPAHRRRPRSPSDLEEKDKKPPPDDNLPPPPPPRRWRRRRRPR